MLPGCPVRLPWCSKPEIEKKGGGGEGLASLLRQVETDEVVNLTTARYSVLGVAKLLHIVTYQQQGQPLAKLVSESDSNTEPAPIPLSESMWVWPPSGSSI